MSAFGAGAPNNNGTALEVDLTGLTNLVAARNVAATNVELYPSVRLARPLGAHARPRRPDAGRGEPLGRLAGLAHHPIRYFTPENHPMSQLTATFDTSRGPIVIALYPDKAPLTVANFVNLAKRGFYDLSLIHI